MKKNSLNPLRELRTILEIKKILKNLSHDILHTFMHKPNIYGGLIENPNLVQTATGLGSFYINNDDRSYFARNMIESLYKVVSKIAKKIIFQNKDDMDYFIKKILREKCSCDKRKRN